MLQLAPAEAPKTGYMFGKGIYFADLVSKSAQYIYPSEEQPQGLLMLCEVALGDHLQKIRADANAAEQLNSKSKSGR